MTRCATTARARSTARSELSVAVTAAKRPLTTPPAPHRSRRRFLAKRWQYVRVDVHRHADPGAVNPRHPGHPHRRRVAGPCRRRPGHADEPQPRVLRR
jgi:hypothetical protein